MESILALFLLSPKVIKPIDNKYIRYVLYALVFILMLLTSITPLSEFVISNGKVHLDITGLRKTSFYSLFILGLVFQYYVSLEKKIDIKKILVQVVLLAWFMFIDSNILYLSMGYLLVQIINFSIIKKNNIEIYTTIALIIFTFMFNNNLFGPWNGYLYILNGLALLGFFFNIYKISEEKFILNEFILILINLTILQTYVSSTQLDTNYVLYGFILMPLFVSGKRIELYTKLLIYSIGLCMIKGDFNIYLITPVFTMIYLVKGLGLKVKDNQTSLISYLTIMILVIIPMLFERSITNFSSHLWILVIVLILLVAEISKVILIKGVDIKDKTLHSILVLIISSVMMGVFL